MDRESLCKAGKVVVGSGTNKPVKDVFAYTSTAEELVNTILSPGGKAKDKYPFSTDAGTVVLYTASVVESEGPGLRTSGRPDEKETK